MGRPLDLTLGQRFGEIADLATLAEWRGQDRQRKSGFDVWLIQFHNQLLCFTETEVQGSSYAPQTTTVGPCRQHGKEVVSRVRDLIGALLENLAG